MNHISVHNEMFNIHHIVCHVTVQVQFQFTLHSIYGSLSLHTLCVSPLSLPDYIVRLLSLILKSNMIHYSSPLSCLRFFSTSLSVSFSSSSSSSYTCFDALCSLFPCGYDVVYLLSSHPSPHQCLIH